MVLNDIKQMSR